MVEWYAGRYQAQLAVHLKKYGLRYDDLYDPMMDLVRLMLAPAFAYHQLPNAEQQQQQAGNSSCSNS
jgi:hypothetical protein